jgi:hypothetical protein
VRAAPALLLTLCTLLASGASPGASLDRDRDSVVLTGSQLSVLVGLAPSSVVAFRYQGGWQQIPVQIDERDTVTLDQVYGCLGHWHAAPGPARRGRCAPTRV